MADLNANVRDIIERPIADLVGIGLEGGRSAAIFMLAFQMILRLGGINDTEALMRLRREIDDALEAGEHAGAMH
jgi:hypothetical protein